MSFPNSTLFPGLAVRSTNAAPGSSYSDSHFQYVWCWSSWATDQLWTCLARQLDVFQRRKLGVWEGAREFCRGGWARLLVCSFWVRRVFSWLNRATILGFIDVLGILFWEWQEKRQQPFFILLSKCLFSSTKMLSSPTAFPFFILLITTFSSSKRGRMKVGLQEGSRRSASTLTLYHVCVSSFHLPRDGVLPD